MSKANDSSIEKKLEELRQQVEWFESDEFTIDEALERFEKASKLADEVASELREVKNKVTVLQEKFTQ